MPFSFISQGYENKVVELQVVGYKLRALQYYRYINKQLSANLWHYLISPSFLTASACWAL